MHLDFKTVSNFRDASIHNMSSGKIFRSAKLSNLSISERNKLEILNIYKVIDFRDPREIKKSPDNLSPYLKERYINLSISAQTLSRMVTACKDNKDDIVVILKDWLNNKKIDAIITTGGTGLTGRDITPEALDEIADKHIPGFGEMFRYISIKSVGTSSIQSRACAVLSNGKYVFALPGSSGGVTDAWDEILKYQLDINHKPCNFVELFPRLKEK